uniref:Regulatory protein zeste n=1 Tax=Timema douglasi TaxID=61478 RepID=A0A7R8VMR5_TIMDO|nr:unnamed protein product [Timema douglasi]
MGVHEFHDLLVRTEFYDEVKTDKAMKSASTSHFNEVILSFTDWPSQPTDEPRAILTANSLEFRSTYDIPPTVVPVSRVNTFFSVTMFYSGYLLREKRREKSNLADDVTSKTKKTDAVTSKQKEAAWKGLADDFNKNTTSVERYSEQLKIYYENYKRRVKKATADDKMELYKTGGRIFIKQLDDQGAKLIALLKPQLVPLVNLSDSDAGYHFEFPGKEQVEKQSGECLVNPTHSTFIENPVVIQAIALQH